MEQMTDMGPEVPKRPGFLTVLCILSYVGTGFGLLGGIWNLIQAPSALEKAQEAEALVSGSPLGGAFGGMMEGAMKMAEYAYPLAILAILANGLCLAGVLMMWKLKKTGFFIYTLAQLAAIIVPVVLVGFSGFFGGMMIFGAIFPIAFIIMYALNLKYMK